MCIHGDRFYPLATTDCVEYIQQRAKILFSDSRYYKNGVWENLSVAFIRMIPRGAPVDHPGAGRLPAENIKAKHYAHYGRLPVTTFSGKSNFGEDTAFDITLI
ncbi:hypothetical protein EVAR_60866_1 [Eumeta japonica]|uniref:Uncharacterized protein n=1 Tax=Eumeta variegata TaxID=151549 RepID=A0A4C1Y742_EUMVA|nr:hypothetical protein EVAR_60866_1 [Eumeta japonica]